MRFAYIDTNVLLRFLLGDIADQLQFAKDAFLLAKEGQLKIILTPIVFFEIIYTLRSQYKLPKEEIATQLGKLLALPYLSVEEEAILKSTLSFWLKSKLDLVDCYLLVKAENDSADVLTFDSGLKKKLKKL